MGWLFYRRVKTGKPFHRPMNRVVHAHLRDIMPADARPDAPVSLGGGARPNSRFQSLCSLAGINPRLDIETGREEAWEPKDLRKTCATYHDENVPESSVEILAIRSVGAPIATMPTGLLWRTGPSRRCRSRPLSRHW